MNIFYIILVLVAVGVALYLINENVPMAPKIKTILNWAVVIIVVVWLLKISGAWAYLSKLTL